MWDVFAISTYLTVSATFLMVGLVPDVAAVRDHVSGWKKKLYSMLSLGWTGADSARSGGLSTPEPSSTRTAATVGGFTP